MSIKDQALKLIGIISRLESCIDEIKGTGDLSEWMSPDGIALLDNNLTRIRSRKPTLERLINTPPHDVTAHFGEGNIESEIESYESLLFHLRGTLKIARNRQNSFNA